MNLIKRTVFPVIVAVVVAAFISGIWYSPMLFGKQWVALRSEALHVAPDSHIAPWKPIVEVVREFVVAYVVTRLVSRLKITRVSSALSLGFWVWMGFPVAMLVGAGLWDNKPWALSLIHGGDWFTKMLAMSVVIMFTRSLTLRQRESEAIESPSGRFGKNSTMRETKNQLRSRPYLRIRVHSSPEHSGQVHHKKSA